MSDYMSQFVAFLRESGFDPSDKIIADDKRHRLKQNEDGGRKTSASYQLKISDLGCIGWVHDFKSGQTFHYQDKNCKKLSPEELLKIKQEIRYQKRRKEKAIEESYAAAKKEAEKIWNKSKKRGTHRYIFRKKIALQGARINHPYIAVPVYDKNMELINIQKIYENNKVFLDGGKVKEGFCPLISNNNREKIIVCEGWATGVSINMATSLPVLCGFMASNILAVARIAREKYPESKIVIAADNDYENKENTGVKAGLHAAQAINGECVWPKTENDWNDVYIKHGLEAVKTAIMGSLPRS